MTELQQVVWAGLGVVAVLLLKWLFEIIKESIQKGQKLESKAENEQLKRMEKTINAIDLRSKATVGALGSMNTAPELKSFSYEFRKKYNEKKTHLKDYPDEEFL
jgi:hypothetical protein